MKLKRIWITWENQRRNRELSQAFGAELFELAAIDEIENPSKKYIHGIIKTLNILFKEKPQLVFCQNPSIVLSFVLVLIRHLFKIKLCVDAHNAGLFPKEGRSSFLCLLSRFVQRGADLTIVTNEKLKQHVEMSGGRAFVLQDRIPSIPIMAPLHLKGNENILFICSYASDEPYDIVFKAARNLDPGIFIYVTGDYRKKAAQVSGLPRNLVLTGYLPEREYIEMLNSVDATIDLTTREDCLVCGAYESLSVEKPIILSSSQALRGYFNMGAIYTENKATDIEKAVYEVLAKKEDLIKEIKQLKVLRNVEWRKRKNEIEEVLMAFSHDEIPVSERQL